MKIAFLSALLATTATVWADVVYLNDGSRLEGDVHKSGDGWVLTTGPGKKQHLDAEQIKRIELGSNDVNPVNAETAEPSALVVGRIHVKSTCPAIVEVNV